MRIAVIGGASSYTPELIDGFYRRTDQLPLSEVVLLDPRADRVEITSGFARRMGEQYGNPFAIRTTAELSEAVDGADFVLTQIRVGGSAARIRDEKLGLDHGLIGQETTGIGGFACALRTIPAVLEIARAMESHAPDATLINFTNPAGIVTEGVLRHSSIRTVGLCNIPIGIVMEVVNHFGCDVDEVAMDYVGLNHLSWVRGFRIGERDVTDEMLDFFIEHARKEWEIESIREAMRLAMRNLKMFTNYYLQYFYATDDALAHLQSKPKTRGEEVVGIEQALFAKYADPAVVEKPEELGQRGGAHYSTAAFRVIEAIHHNLANAQVVCCRNEGAVPGFDDNAALEIPARIDAAGAHALPQETPTPEIGGLMQCVKAYETLTVEAAVTGSRDAALQAMVMNPLMPGYAESEKLLDALVDINREYIHPGLSGRAGLAHA